MASNNSDENKSWARKAFEAVEQAAAKKEREIPESIKVPGLPVAVQPSEYEAPSGGGVWGDVAKGLYDTAMSDYNRLKSMYTDQTEEAKKIRSTWETAPTVSVKNGRLKLSGSKDFLASPEAKQLKETMKGMQGGTYNTEDLNKQIESWNAVLAQMSNQYINALDTLNPMNATIAQSVEGTTREDFQKYFTLNDLQKIGNSAAVGKQQDARKTKNKIFVGFEWDDEGNMIEKWVDAADFFNEFNAQSDDEKRSAYHSLITQANLGDVGAYSKLMYLQGGSQGGPANVDIDGTGTFFENILQGAEAGAAGVLQDIFDYAPILNLGTIGGNLSNAAQNADERNFWDWAAAIMAPGLYADKYDSRTGLLKVYNDAVTDFNNLRDWSNTYTAELNPASTEIGRTVGDFAGGALRIAGDIYAFGKLGRLEADTKFAAMQIANQKFASSSAFTPMGQIYIKKYGVQVADQVTPLADNGGVATMGTVLRDTTTVTPFGGIYVPTILTKISPKFTQFLEEAALAFTEVQFARNASQFISRDGSTILQFGTASPASTSRMTWTTEGGIASGQGGFVEGAIQWGSPKTFTSGSNIRSAWDTFSQSFDNATSSSTALSNTVNFSRSYELLKSLRNKDTILGISKGLQTAQALSNLVGFAAMRNVDDYFQKVEAGEDVGDMANYVITHTAEDAVWGGLIMKAGGMMKFFKRGADASAKPTVEYVQEVYDGMANSQSGWYMPGSYASNRFSLGPGELTSSESADLADTLSSVMTVNGEAVTGFTGELGGVSAVPGTNIKEAGKALGVYSPSKITRLSVRPANGGAYLIREETNLDTNTKVETRKFYTDIEEATKAAGAEAVPKTSPKTLENSDQVKDAKVAPLTINGKAPNVMPDGVSQVRVQPGIVYYGPDEMVDAVVNLAADSGWHETNLDRLYQDYERFVQEAQTQQGAIEHMSEAPAVPKEMYGTDIDGLLRLAAWAKINGYTLIPMKTEPTTKFVKVGSRNQKVILGKEPSQTTKSIVEYDRRLRRASRAINELEAKVLGTPVGEIVESARKSILDKTGVDINDLPFDLTNDGNMDVLRILDERPGSAANNSIRDYYRKEKGLETTVVLISPEAYNKILRRYNTSSDTLRGITNDRATAQYTLDMQAGDKFPTPVLRFDNSGFDGQEGRHRAVAAANNGFKYIPVGIRHPAGSSVEDYVGDNKYFDITDEVANIVTATAEMTQLKDWQDIISIMDNQRQNLIEQQSAESSIQPTGKAGRKKIAPEIYYKPFKERHLTEGELDRQMQKIPEDLQIDWYARSSRGARDKIADIVLSDPKLRNAALSKMYDQWRKTMRTVGGEWNIDYSDWLNTDITLYRWSGKENANYTPKVLSFSFEPGGYQQFGETPTVITVKPRETVGMADYWTENSEEEVFVPVEIVKNRAELDKELKERQRAAIIAIGKEAPEVDEIKTFQELMDRDTLLSGTGSGLGLNRADLLKALITNKITVYAAEPIYDGVVVSPIKIGPYSEEVNLSDVAWRNTSSGILAKDTIYPTLFDYATFISSQTGGEIVRVRSDIPDRVVETPNNFVGMEYGVPKAYFPDATSALEWAAQSNIRAVHELSDEPMTLDRPPVTTETLDEPLLLESGASAENYLERLAGLLQSMQEMEDSDINYSYGIIDALKQVRGIYSQVSANVNLTDIYARYAQSIYNNEMIELTPDERKALKPLTDALDALGHYFDPSGKSLTQEFYLPTGAATRNKVSIEEALLGKDEITDVEFPADGGLEEILIDADRIGDSGFWQRRTGELFMDSEGNFTMSKAAPLEDNLIAYTVSALTRGPHKLTLAVNNEVARSKANPNRTQITAKQARAMLQEADTLRTKTRSYQLGTHKDAEKIAKLKMDYTGDESTVDQALREKNYAKKLNYTRALNTLSQKGGFNQFLDIHPIKGSATRFGVGPYKGTANIKRKMSEINITGTMYKYDNGHWENYGFGIEPSQANIKKYGVFKDGGGTINLGEILKFNFESQQRALDFYGKLKENLKNYAAGDGEALQVQLDTFARENFPLHTNIDRFSAKLMKEFGKNLYAYNNDVIAAEAANVDSVEKWLRTGALICFNNAIQMGDIQNLDKRTIEALDDAAAELLLGSPVKRSAAINFLQRWSVDSALSLNANLVIGNVGSEIFTRLPGYVGTPETIRAFVKALNRAEFRRVRNILKDLPLHFDDSNSALARRVYNRVSEAVSKGEDVALTPLTWSELFKNVVYYLAGERNAIKSGITDPVEIGQSALNFVGEHAIAGGRGTTPGIAQSDLGRVLFIFKTFTIRNFDDFLDFVKKASHGRSGDNYWDKKYEKRHKGDDKDTIDLKIAARVIGGRAFRSYIFWLFVGSYLGKSLLDILGGDPTGILEGGYDRGLYDDPDTEEYEGMTDFDNFINNIPAGFILGALQDLYFAARRRGIESKQFFALDIFNDPRLQKDLSKKLPLGVAKNRLGDMLSLLDRGYSFSSTGKKTYAAPDTVWDLTKGFLFGKSTTANSLAYGKYRYGNVNVWGDISSGDWMDFAINANPLTDIFGGSAKFDTTRKDYTGVFDGSWNDIATMQLIVQQFRERNKQIIADFQENKYRYRGDYEGLTDEEKLAKAKEQREKDIDKFTDDVQRAVDAFTKAGNTLSDSQITTMMSLFDFHEGEEDDEWNSSYARERYVEAGLPDYSALGVKRVEKKTDEGTEEETQNILDRSLILKNAQQGFYGSSKEAANAIKDALKDFGSTYKAYNTRVKALNGKYFEARNKNKKSAETKRLSQDLEKLQNEYLDKLFDKIAPVIDQYGTALVGTYDGADILSDYMGNMIPYSSIKEYGQTYSSGNDVVYGQLTEWLQKRLGRNAPTAPSDKEVTSGISDIKKLIDQGKAAAAKSKARAILEKIGRGSLGARRDDVETLRSYVYD